MTYSITTINGGFANNVIPDSCEFTGSIRTFLDEDRIGLPNLMEEILKEICEKNGTKFEAEFKAGCDSSVVNTPKCAQFVRRVAKKHYGDEAVSDVGTPIYGAEDFADYLGVIPGAFFWRVMNHLNEDQKLHCSNFDFDDNVIEDTAELYAKVVLERLNID